MMNQRQTKISTLEEADPATEEAEALAEDIKDIKEEAIISEETIADMADIETTARRLYLNKKSNPKNLLQAVKGAAKSSQKAQWIGWAMYYVPWTHRLIFLH